MSKKRTRQVYKAINVRLSLKGDSDVIAWWDSLTPGEGSALVKQIIKRHLTSKNEVTNNVPATRSDAIEIADSIIGLRQLLEGLTNQISSGVQVMSMPMESSADGYRLSDNEAKDRVNKVIQQKW